VAPSDDGEGELLSLLDEPPPRAAATAAARDRYAADGSCAHPDVDPFERCRLCGADVSELG